METRTFPILSVDHCPVDILWKWKSWRVYCRENEFVHLYLGGIECWEDENFAGLPVAFIDFLRTLCHTYPEVRFDIDANTYPNLPTFATE